MLTQLYIAIWRNMPQIRWCCRLWTHGSLYLNIIRVIRFKLIRGNVDYKKSYMLRQNWCVANWEHHLFKTTRFLPFRNLSEINLGPFGIYVIIYWLLSLLLLVETLVSHGWKLPLFDHTQTALAIWSKSRLAASLDLSVRVLWFDIGRKIIGIETCILHSSKFILTIRALLCFYFYFLPISFRLINWTRRKQTGQIWV